eukprot:598010_1
MFVRLMTYSSKTMSTSDSGSPFRSDVLQGRVALITGGGSGIGFGIAEEMAKHGASVVLMGRRLRFLEDAVKLLTEQGFKAACSSGDVRKPADCQRAVDTAMLLYGHLDTVVCSHAGNFLAAAETLSYNGFKTVMDIDTIGVFNVCRAAFKQLRASKRGSVINISAVLHYGATWYQAHASAAKAAIDSLTRSLALEWGAYNIRVNAIAPGPIAHTPGMSKLAGGISQEQLDKKLMRTIPLGRSGRKSEIAWTAIFLCSSGAGFTTGDSLVVDGGSWLAGPPPVPREVVLQISRNAEKKSRNMTARSKM